MAMQLDPDLPGPLVPLAWLIGRWEGAGVVGYPTMDSVNFGQEIEFRHDGRPFLHYRSQAWLLDDEGNQVRPLASEVGYWRPKEDHLEVLLSHPTGYVEIYVGQADGPRIELATDVVARTETAKEYTAAKRMYGLVNGDLLWAMDMAAVGQPLQSHASAQLKRKWAFRARDHKIEKALEDQLKLGRILAKVTSRPGQHGRADGQLLEGAELAFYQKKLESKKKTTKK